jgi:hypothetical protein
MDSPAPSPPRPLPESAAAFPHWRETLARSRLPRGQRGRYAIEIGRFLRYCEILAVSANTSRARTYLAMVPLSVSRPLAAQALRWYLRAARRPPPPPPPSPQPEEAWWSCFPIPEESGPPGEGW